ncbi:MAG: hypothetical protein KA792_10100 [Bacteroidales bacterium]|nr:hypothetical protein [Bacteroidales bacterium]
MAKSQLRPIVVLKITSLRILGNFILKMHGIYANMTLNAALFPNPPVALATFLTNIEALEEAEQKVKTKLKGSAETRNQAYDLVLDNVHNLQNYVQSLADNAAEYDDALNIIARSGFDVKGRGVREKPDFYVKNGEVSGEILLYSKAAASRASYEWRMSADQQIWTDLPDTIQSKTKVSGLTPGQLYYFKKRAITKAGPRSWSQIVAIYVV